MIIFALLTQNEEFKNFVEDLQQVISVGWEHTADAIFLKLNECDGVLLDLDTDQKRSDKLIKKIRKTHPDLPVMVLANNLDAKKLAKHQKSKHAPDIYFRYPTDQEVLKIMLSEFYEVSETELTDTSISLQEQELLDDHTEAQEISPAAKKTSSKMDDAFEDVFPDEFSEMEEEKQVAKASLDDEFSLDDDGGDDLMSLDDSGDDDFLSLGDDDDDLVDLSATGDSEIMDLGDDDDTLTLGSEDVSSVEEDTLMLEQEDDTLMLDGEDEEEDTQLPSSEDLEFPNVEEITSSINLEMSGLAAPAVGGADEAPVQEMTLEAEEPANEKPAADELSLDGDDGELSLGDFDLSGVENDDSEIAMNTPEESVDSALDAGQTGLSIDEDASDIGIDLSDGDTSSQIGVVDEEVGLDLSEAESSQTSSAIDISMDVISEEAEVDESFDPFADTEDTGMEIERKEAPPEETIEAIKAAEVDTFMEPGTQVVETEDQTGVSFVDESALIQPAEMETAEEDLTEVADQFELSDSPPDFTATIQRKMQEIDAMVEEDATVVAQIPSAEELAAVEEEEEPTQMFQAPSAEEMAEPEGEEETKVHNADELVKALEDEKDDGVSVSSEISQTSHVDQSTKQDYYEYVQNRDEELMRLGETIKSLRADRENLMDKIGEFEEKDNSEKRDFLSLQAELDEKKIEVEILKKRYHKELDDLKFRLDITSEKKDVLTAKNRQYEAEFEKLRREKNVDMNRVRSRERELEERLELLKRDSEVQIRNRDQKILELKRRIDTLEFDIENAHLRERKQSTDHDLLENRLDKVIQTLRGVIGQLEDDTITDRQKLIKKNLDV